MPLFGIKIQHKVFENGVVEIEAESLKEARRHLKKHIKNNTYRGGVRAIKWNGSTTKYSIGESVEKITSVSVPNLQAVDTAFGNVDHLPPIDKIPQEFLDSNHEFKKIVNHWFFSGLNKDVLFFSKDGIDSKKAYTALEASLRSWAPKHEHKEAGVAYLMYLWFDKVENWKKKMKPKQHKKDDFEKWLAGALKAWEKHAEYKSPHTIGWLNALEMVKDRYKHFLKGDLNKYLKTLGN